MATGEVYHVFNKSIAGFEIFNDRNEFLRMINVIRYYQKEKPTVKFSAFIKSSEAKQNRTDRNISYPDKEKLVEIIAYCLMPTHLHLIVRQLKEKGISTFMNNVLNSYTRYFNTRHKRKGPLWEGRFKSVLIKTDEQLLHLTRYVHLNPTTAYLVDKLEAWSASSYQEYVGKVDDNDRICKYDEFLKIKPSAYKEFVEDRVSYQRELAKIKDLSIE